MNGIDGGLLRDKCTDINFALKTVGIYLLRDSLTQCGLNKSYISHIIAANPNGPRGSGELSEELEIVGSNLILLCDECHNHIDEAAVADHSVELLRKMKRDHEQRIELVTSLLLEKRSHVVFFGATIGVHRSPLEFAHAVDSMLPENFRSSSAAFIDKAWNASRRIISSKRISVTPRSSELEMAD
jgi:hypothetical protein